jgi:hypothetical protein
MTIRYRAGNEENPMDQLGRVDLTIEADGRARLVHRFRGRRSEYRGAVDAADLARLHSALASAGFPRPARQGVRPDSRLCTLDVDGESVRVARRAPEYDEALALLDALVEELSR